VNGSVYFDVSKWPEYGKLSGRKVEDQQAGARVEVNPEKRHPADFALWKRAEPEHLMQWKSPWGRGYPGWHIECSTMSIKYLGETFDIHGGGIENQFPHHECEIAQSEAATGKPFARYWMHNNMVLVNGVKMSKSLGNFTTISQALEKYSGEQIRFFILQTHYRSPVDFSDEALEAAGIGLQRLLTAYRNLQQALTNAAEEETSPQIKELADKVVEKFKQAMDDDFNTPAAISHLFDFAREINKIISEDGSLSRASLELLKTTFEQLAGDVLGVLPAEEESREIIRVAPLIELLIDVRNELRRKKEWQLADKIRDEMLNAGILLEDKKEGTTWRYKM